MNPKPQVLVCLIADAVGPAAWLLLMGARLLQGTQPGETLAALIPKQAEQEGKLPPGV